MWEVIEETCNYIKSKVRIQPKIAIILGSGLNHIVDDMIIDISLSYEDIPHFPVSTVEGHEGKLIFATLNGVDVMVMQGRFHYYEGYDMKQITFPVRVMKNLGIALLILSNASGGVNPGYQIGDIVLVTDHINLFPENPLRGKNDERLGPGFPI